MVQYWCHLDHFGPPWSSQKLSGRPPKASLDLDRRPESSPKRNPPFSYGKTTHLEDQNCHLGATNKPQPPPPVKLSFDSAPYTSSCKGPNSPTPQGRRIQRACGHMRRPWKRDRNPTSPSPKTQNSNRNQNPKLKRFRPVTGAPTATSVALTDGSSCGFAF